MQIFAGLAKNFYDNNFLVLPRQSHPTKKIVTKIWAKITRTIKVGLCDMKYSNPASCGTNMVILAMLNTKITQNSALLPL